LTSGVFSRHLRLFLRSLAPLLRLCLTSNLSPLPLSMLLGKAFQSYLLLASKYFHYPLPSLVPSNELQVIENVLPLLLGSIFGTWRSVLLGIFWFGLLSLVGLLVMGISMFLPLVQGLGLIAHVYCAIFSFCLPFYLRSRGLATRGRLWLHFALMAFLSLTSAALLGVALWRPWSGHLLCQIFCSMALNLMLPISRKCTKYLSRGKESDDEVSLSIEINDRG
jgi:hypothetical protein